LQILPFLEQGTVKALYNPDYRAEDPINEPATRQQISVYQCPSDDAAGRVWSSAAWDTGNAYNDEFSRSNYVVCMGSSVYIPSGASFNADYSETDTDGPFRVAVGRELREFSDGTSGTAMASEILAGKFDVYPDSDYRGKWAWEQMGESAYTHFDTPNTSAPDLLLSYKCSGATEIPDMPCTPATSLSDERATARSRHPGGVNVLFGDGHVSFYGDTIELVVWQALSTIEGEETVGE
jgi:prepilin-type processing-associated H-X9-DG protein